MWRCQEHFSHNCILTVARKMSCFSLVFWGMFASFFCKFMVFLQNFNFIFVNFNCLVEIFFSIFFNQISWLKNLFFYLLLKVDKNLPK